ncbi:hypothetical protein BHE74_00056759, partial [Ensete ventricosum]
EGSEDEGWLAMASPLAGPATHAPAARAAASKGGRSCKGNTRARRHRPSARCRPRAAAHAAGAAAHADDVQRHRLRRAAATTAVVAVV